MIRIQSFPRRQRFRLPGARTVQRAYVLAIGIKLSAGAAVIYLPTYG